MKLTNEKLPKASAMLSKSSPTPSPFAESLKIKISTGITKSNNKTKG
jgi:hypothetical protein